MTGSIPPPSPLSYEGQVVVPFIKKTFNPQTTFNQFPVPTIWINSAISKAFILVSKAMGIAIWVPIGGAPGEIETITTPDGTVVVPTAENINFLNGTGLNITGAGSNITFNCTGGGLAWTDVTTTTQAMAINNGYVADNGSLVTLTLPPTAAFGSIIAIVGRGIGGWTIAQNAGQQIICGTNSTSVGGGGSVSSTNRRDSIFLLCTNANTEFTRITISGNLTLV